MVYAAAHTKIATFNANGLTTKVPVSDNFRKTDMFRYAVFCTVTPSM